MITRFVFIAFCVIAAWLQQFAWAENYQLIIVAGQSNAQGWAGNAKELAADPDDKNIPMYYVFPESNKPGEKDHSSQTWTHLGPQKGRFPDGHFGPEIGLARLLYKANLRPAVFKYSKGSSSLLGNWGLPGTGKLTDAMLEHLTTSLEAMKKAGHTVQIGAFVWIQGESDSKKGARESYSQHFDQLVAAISKIMGEKNIPIILGIDEQHQYVVNNPEILEFHKAYAKQHDNAEYTSMLNLTKADTTHLTPKALIEHGERLYDAYKILHKLK